MKAEKTMDKRFYLLMMSCLFAMVSFLDFTGGARTQQDYPILDTVANKVIQKYQQSTCEQLWQDRGQAKTGDGRRSHPDAAQRSPDAPVFINKVAAPIANKLFECGMIP